MEPVERTMKGNQQLSTDPLPFARRFSLQFCFILIKSVVFGGLLKFPYFSKLNLVTLFWQLPD